MATFGKLEYRITVPTGGWDTTVGGVTKTIPAGTYFLSSADSGSRSLLAEVAFQFGATSVAGSLSENGTGLVTIQFAGSTAITWVDTELRDILGFAANLAGATSHVGTLHARGTWIPQAPPYNLNTGGHWRGSQESDFRSADNPAGYLWAVMGQSRTVMEDLAWSGIKRHKVWIANETDSGYTNQSLQKFWQDGVWGTSAWGTAGGPIRYYPDAALDTDYGTYKVKDTGIYKPEQMGWPGMWRWKMPKLIQVPGSEAQGLGGSSRATIAMTSRESASSTTNTTIYTTGSFTPNPDRLQLLGVLSTSSGTAEVPLSVVGCGLTWELVTSVTFPTATRKLSVYRAMGSSPSAGTLTITFLSTHSSCLWAWEETTGADTGGTNGSSAVVQSVTNTAGAASVTINATLAALENAANAHVAFVGISINGSITPDAQFAELGDDAESTPDSTLECEWAANQTACDPTFAAAQAAIISVEVKSAAA